MAFRFGDTFSHYTTNADMMVKWTSGGPSTSITSGAGRFTGNALRCGAASEGVFKTLDNQATWAVGFGIKNTSFGAAGVICSLFDGQWNSQVELRLNSNGTLSLTRNGTALTGGTTSAVIPVNTWHGVGFVVTIGTSIAASSAQIYVDGVLAATVTAGQSTQATANPYASIVALNDGGNNNTGNPQRGASIWFCSDFWCCDGTGAAPWNGFLGDVRGDCLLPNAAGDLTQWTATGAASNFAAVNEAAENGDTSYVADAIVGDYDFYKYPALSSTSASIYAVQAVPWARKDDANVRQVCSSLRIGGANYDGPTRTLSASYQGYPNVWQVNPATGVAFTAADLAAGTFQAGNKVVS